MAKKQYIGKNKVIGITNLDSKSPKGQTMVEIILDGNKNMITSKKVFDIIVTDKEIDDTELRERKIQPLLEEISGVIMEYDISHGDIRHLTERMANRLLFIFDKVNNLLWTGKDANFVPGYDPMQDRTLLEANKIFNELNERKESKGK